MLVTDKFQHHVEGIEWDYNDSFIAQHLCVYETVRTTDLHPWVRLKVSQLTPRFAQVALGFSRFCDLFTYDEWLGFEYFIDIVYSGNFGFQSTTGVRSVPPSFSCLLSPPPKSWAPAPSSHTHRRDR